MEIVPSLQPRTSLSSAQKVPRGTAPAEPRHRGSFDHRRKSSNSEHFRSGRFSWVKRLMNNNKTVAPQGTQGTQGSSKDVRKNEPVNQEAIPVTVTRTPDERNSFCSTEVSTGDNISTRPILSNSSDESDNEDDEIDSSYKYYDPSVKSTAMTSIAPTAFTSASSSVPSNMIIVPGGSSGTQGHGTSILSYTGSTTPTAVSFSHQTAHGADSSSVITIASSTRNRRRRSIDTNASTSAIPPASIFERIITANTSTSKLPASESPSRAPVSEQDSVASGDYCSAASH
ncbi:hypothetical protein KL905_004675 [Ogataea polymorpha]|nr:hypothetical protein KL908_000631 [Ogataea polymorpha]KAG7903917.1 hypothetical protein KL935_000056 [Ogataea polymorpha]KAG7908579.1 hypothetical protein KL907_002069 [Ogataea polymorpha]KAG7916272.1 hypothetical protein KL905_004675 [Ogataea polymorpha]KAG7920811.1 hypothetical protein KL927_000055 [Ogataea polymorpha]